MTMLEAKPEDSDESKESELARLLRETFEAIIPGSSLYEEGNNIEVDTYSQVDAARPEPPNEQQP